MSLQCRDSPLEVTGGVRSELEGVRVVWGSATLEDLRLLSFRRYVHVSASELDKKTGVLAQDEKALVMASEHIPC